ncbi:hypothetical protein DCAR_0205476 [Daucus carota subsp. sativus]|uniref:Uncharacterized protein n=1 Tax=Daucus carota subsp. sativus TaxID=79200 RepID=A0AAF0WDZ3_DAUCS|nr:PREDICTED: transcription termination factor MTERF15, mitochondrial-like [Daucus carota subsp. sativus]WOG86275.1 hypothetical protein DCAR_0205476 [Daucus carota subsp. sativus]
MAISVLKKPNSFLYSLIVSSQDSIFLLSNSKPVSFSTESNDPIHSSQQLSQKSHLHVFQRYGFQASELTDFLKKNHFLLNYSSSDIEKSLKILLSLKSCPKFVASVVYSCPNVLELEFLERWKMGFKESGVFDFSSLAVKNVVAISRKFELSPCDFFRCVESFRNFGFGSDTVEKVLEVNPMVIMAGEESILDKVRFLERMGLERRGIDWVLGKFPEFLSFGVENRLIPLMSEFRDLGYSRGEVKKGIVRDPRVIGLEVGELSQCLRMLRSLKCRLSVKEEILKEGTFRAGYEVKLRVDCLCKYGLIRREALSIIWREPRMILYDLKEIERKIDFLLNEMKLDVQWLLDVPEYLGISFEKQIVPRHNVIEYLRSIGGLGEEVGLKSLIKLTRLKFHNLYVKPYPECEKIYGRFAEQVNLKNQHPVGLSKLFKPQKYPQSKEVAKNIRSFMEPLGKLEK